MVPLLGPDELVQVALLLGRFGDCGGKRFSQISIRSSRGPNRWRVVGQHPQVERVDAGSR
jgi:hypothetical protein